jgi:hypothetical protein
MAAAALLEAGRPVCDNTDPQYATFEEYLPSAETEAEEDDAQTATTTTSAADTEARQRRQDRVVRLIVAVSLVLAALALVVVGHRTGAQRSPVVLHLETTTTATTMTSSSTTDIVTTVTNEYTSTSTKIFPYPFLEGGHLMEPYKEHTVTLSGSTSTKCIYSWTLSGTSARVADQSFKGTVTKVDLYGKPMFTVTPAVTGPYSLTVLENCYADGSKRTLTKTVWVKYVRRELMSLTDTDREEFLDAFRTLWDVNTKDGKKKYGDAYKSLAYFAVLHNDGGGNGVCDEFHAGSGFINNHLYLGAYLEQSLRLVNPKVSLHYMEYSKYFSSAEFQTHVSNQLDGGAWTELMTAKWFGASDPVTGEVLDGRWAHTAIPTMTKKFFKHEGIDTDTTFFPAEEASWLTAQPAHLTSPYGLLRSPWNYNPAPFLTRYNNVNQISNLAVLSDEAKTFYLGRCSGERSPSTPPVVPLFISCPMSALCALPHIPHLAPLLPVSSAARATTTSTSCAPTRKGKPSRRTCPSPRTTCTARCISPSAGRAATTPSWSTTSCGKSTVSRTTRC